MGIVKFLYYKNLLFLICIQLVARLKKETVYNQMRRREYFLTHLLSLMAGTNKTVYFYVIFYGVPKGTQ